MSSIGKVIADLRTELGLSQADLAQVAELSENTIWKIENERSPGSRTTVEKIAQALQITVSELYRRAGQLPALAADPPHRDPLEIRWRLILHRVPPARRAAFVTVIEELVKLLI